MPGRSVSPVFVGRSEELELAASVLDRVGVGGATHLLISGEAGVGKTRFSDEVSRLARERGIAVLRGACVAVGAAFVLRGKGGGWSGSGAAQGALFTEAQRDQA